MPLFEALIRNTRFACALLWSFLILFIGASGHSEDSVRPVTGPNSFLNLPEDSPKPVVQPATPKASPLPSPVVTSKALPRAVKTPDDLLRDLPVGIGLYHAGTPNASGLAKANAPFTKNSLGRPVDFQIAVGTVGRFNPERGGILISSQVAPHRHVLDEITVRVEILAQRGQKDLLAKLKRGNVVAVTGTVGKAELRNEGGKVQLVLRVNNPVVE